MFNFNKDLKEDIEKVNKRLNNFKDYIHMQDSKIRSLESNIAKLKTFLENSINDYMPIVKYYTEDGQYVIYKNGKEIYRINSDNNLLFFTNVYNELIFQKNEYLWSTSNYYILKHTEFGHQIVPSENYMELIRIPTKVIDIDNG